MGQRGGSEKPSGTQIFFHIYAPLSLGYKLLSSLSPHDCKMIAASPCLVSWGSGREKDGRRKEELICVRGTEGSQKSAVYIYLCLVGWT